MDLPLSIIIVHANKDRGLAFELVLKENFQITDTVHVNSPLKAIQALLEDAYDICFISDEIEQKYVDSFFADIRKVTLKRPCALIKFTKKEDFDASVAHKDSGRFATTVREKLDELDKENVFKALQALVDRLEIEETAKTVQGNVPFLLSKIDRAAKEKKRGRERTLDLIAKTWRDVLSSSDPELIESFHEILAEKTEAALPARETNIKVPEDVLKRELPHLGEDGYEGSSFRVWDKLIDKFGVAKSDKAPEVAESAPVEELPTEQDS